MRKLNSMENFKRDIAYYVLVQEDESIFLTGTLKDCFHDIEVKIVVDGATLMIRTSQCIVMASPSSYCKQIEARLELLNGIVIGKGLSRKLSEIFGGSEGCGNLRTILTGLLPLALNVKASLGIVDDKEVLANIHRRLQGSCVGYPVIDEA
jgi:hypothetical protein